MNKEQADQFWQDKKSWIWWGIYYRKEDPRVIVPTRLRWSGWTVNFAHPIKVTMATLISVLIAIGPTLFIVFLGPHTYLNVLGAMAISVTLLVVLANYFATRYH